MLLKDFLQDDRLNQLRELIGAPLSFYKIRISLPKPVFKNRSPPPIPSPAPLPERGLDVEKGAVAVHADGTLLFNGRRVVVHLRDIVSIGGRQHMPRFHLANCSTLIDMRNNGRFARYVVSDRDTGLFHIRKDSGPLSEELLPVCQNCLAKLLWDGFTPEMPREKRHSIVLRFSIPRFFQRYPRSLHPTLPEHTAETAPINDYPENWDEIAFQLKQQLRFQCQNCRIGLGATKSRFLHVHHVNGLKNDCCPENLRCLCVRCHADQPMHDHMKLLPEYNEFINNFPPS
jgi:hypothetical protein